ncbi:MAG: 50S ribosomal protein L23 [Deltaproteobacteria bacterium]
MKDLNSVLMAPAVTEKGTLVSEKARQVVFQVAPAATKADIREAVEELFGVKVEAVRTLNYLGKPRRAGRRVQGRKAHWKKAYVTLAEGDVAGILEKV